MMMLVFSCMDREDVLQLEQDAASEIKGVKQWFDINKVSLNKEGSDVRAREMSKELILPFFEKEPDWSKFSEYHFRDGRKVYEIHLKNLSGIMPKGFFEEYGNSGSDLVEESLLFVEQPGMEEGYSVLVARYFSYGEKSKGMTYHRIPSGWSGRIDMFSYDERHLRSFEVDEGKIVSHITYQTEEEKKRIGRENALVVCSGYWVDFPYYGISGGVGSSASVYVTECTDVPTGGGGSFGYPSNEGGGGSSGFGDGSGSGSSTSTPCNNTNNFSDHCIPVPESLEDYIESISDPAEKREAQLDYLRSHGGKDLVEIIEGLMNTSGLTVGDVIEINKLVNKFYLQQKGLFIMAIFSPENVGTILTFALANPNLTSTARNKTFQLFSRHATYGKNIVYKSLTSSNFRNNLILKTGMNPSNAQAHHVFPQASEFANFFTSKGINVHSPAYGAWWPTASHQANAYAYNQAWRVFINSNPNATSVQILQFARSIMGEYGIAIMF